MLDTLASNTWLVFALIVATVYFTAFALSPLTRRYQAQMMSWGLIGGPLISIPYAVDFWRPMTALRYIPLESALFGGSFLGLVTALTLSSIDGPFRVENPKTVPRKRKVYLLIAVTMAWLGLWGLGVNSVVATIGALFAGTIFLVGQRPDLQPLVIRGAIASFLAYAVLTGGYLLFVEDVADVARAYSPFYASYGLVWTACILAFWSISFGAFFGPFVLWWQNRYLS